jgi:hypothetical protein
MSTRRCTPREAVAVQRFPASAGGHRFIVPACVVALLCLVVLL